MIFTYTCWYGSLCTQYPGGWDKDCEFKGILSYMKRACLKKTNFSKQKIITYILKV